MPPRIAGRCTQTMRISPTGLTGGEAILALGVMQSARTSKGYRCTGREALVLSACREGALLSALIHFLS